VPSSQGEKFERVAATYFPALSKECKSFLRHKTTMINPHVLAKQDGITVNTCVQETGEFMITFPFAYHAGFNHGFNCAESVNFAQPDWIEYGRKASRCRCTAGTATIDMSIFTARYELFKELGPTVILTDDMVLSRVEQNILEKKDDLQTNKRKRVRENTVQTSSNQQNKRRKTLPHTSDSSATDCSINFTFSQPISSPLSSPSGDFENDLDEEDKTEKKERRWKEECDERYKENKSRTLNSKRASTKTGTINSDSSRGQHIVKQRPVMSCTLLGPHKILISVKKAINV